MRKRKQKLPVIGRLTIAWATVFVVAAGTFIFAQQPSESAPHITAVKLNPIERLTSTADRLRDDDVIADKIAALTETQATAQNDPLAQARGADGAGRPRIVSIPQTNGPSAFGAPAEDRLAQPEPLRVAQADANYDGFADDEIIITIDGKPARDPGDISELSAPRQPVRPIAALRPDLTSATPYGRAPSIGRNGVRPADIYTYSFTPTGDPMVSFIVSGLGLDPALTRRAIDELPPEVTLSFAPYAKDLDFWAEEARKAGHEILVELPMEHGPNSAEAIGPAGLLTSRSAKENAQRIEWLLSRFDGYFGATNYLGATFAADSQSIRPVLKRLRAAGLVFFDDTGAVKRFGSPSAKDMAEVSRLINGQRGDPSEDLAGLERIAKRDGVSLGKAYLDKTSFETVLSWSHTLVDRDLTLAPASALLSENGPSL